MAVACVRVSVLAGLILSLLPMTTSPAMSQGKVGKVASAAGQEPDMTLVAFADLKATVSDVKSLYGGMSSYARITGFWEQKISSRVTQLNAFGGQTVVEAHGPRDEMFMVSYTRVPRNACIRMMARNPNGDALKTLIGSVEGPFTVERASELCQDETILSWVHN